MLRIHSDFLLSRMLPLVVFKSECQFACTEHHALAVETDYVVVAVGRDVVFCGNFGEINLCVVRTVIVVGFVELQRAFVASEGEKVIVTLSDFVNHDEFVAYAPGDGAAHVEVYELGVDRCCALFGSNFERTFWPGSVCKQPVAVEDTVIVHLVARDYAERADYDDEKNV